MLLKERLLLFKTSELKSFVTEVNEAIFFRLSIWPTPTAVFFFTVAALGSR